MVTPPDETTADPYAVIAALRQQLAGGLAERDAALAREAALSAALVKRTAELAARKTEFDERIGHQASNIDVLKAMSASPGDPQRVMDLITRRAAELCESRAALYELRDGQIQMASNCGTAPDLLEAFRRHFPRPPDRSLVVGRAILDRQVRGRGRPYAIAGNARSWRYRAAAARR
jgi:hypothetical protein